MVCFFIFTMDQGIGGHYYSLQTIQKEMPGSRVVVIGYTPPEVYYQNCLFLDLNKLGLLEVLNSASAYSGELEVLHAFDEHSYFFARIISFFKRKKIVLTKCGGKIAGYHPQAEDEVFFTQEDADFYSYRKGARHWVLPNRVSIASLKNRECEVFFEQKSDKVNFLCVARVGGKYKSKILGAIDLVGSLVSKRVDCHLSIIGVPESQSVVDQVRRYVVASNLEVNVSLFLTENFTRDSSRFIHGADIVVGTGRGAMEAMCLGVPTICLVGRDKVPVLVRESNFDRFIYKNFSERVAFDVCPYEESDKIFELIKNSDMRERLRAFYDECARNLFLVDGVCSSYMAVYDKANRESGRFVFDWIANYLYIKYIKWVKFRG